MLVSILVVFFGVDPIDDVRRAEILRFDSGFEVGLRNRALRIREEETFGVETERRRHSKGLAMGEERSDELILPPSLNPPPPNGHGGNSLTHLWDV